ncbi:MAG TPA: thiamine phosphate synthase [bacterium]|nr:thiamine phosphate synthase [bacterium]
MAENKWGEVRFPGLYYIHTFNELGKPEKAALYRTCLDVIQGGCRLVQLRYKGAWSRALAEELRLILHDFHGSDALFLLNDRAEWARETGADGVHVGEDGDTPAALARQTLGPGALIGATAKNPMQLRAALEGNVDYVSWGALYPSATKPDAIPGEVSAIPQRRAELPPSVRLCVIGGITLERIPEIFRYPGADLIAVGGAIQHAKDPELEAMKFIDAIRLASGDTRPPLQAYGGTALDREGE